MKPPRAPSKREMKTDFLLWTRYLKECIAIHREIKSDERTKTFENECDVYKDETDDDRLKRAESADEWIRVKLAKGYVAIQDIGCRNTDTCWYGRNTDRLNGCEFVYRLKGTSVMLCDMCIQDLDEMLEIEDVMLAIRSPSSLQCFRWPSECE